MRISGFIAFLLFAAFPALLSAQGGAGATGQAGSGVTSPTVTTSVDNQVEAAAFVGGGRPDAFVGTTDVFTRTATTSRTTRTVTTTARARTATATTQRQAGTASRITAASGTQAGQTIQSATSLDFDFTLSPSSLQRTQPAIATGLTRIQGIQDSQLSLTASPIGTTAVLTGTVSSDRARKVAQQLLLMEPGIQRVENLLEIR